MNSIVRHPRPRLRARRVVAVLVVIVATGLLVLAWGASSRVAATVASGTSIPDAVRTVMTSGLDAEDGFVGSRGLSVFADAPAVSRLDADLLSALRSAANDAAAQGVTFVVNSGWRSERLQQRLLDDAVAEYGSRDEAARWVATPETSAHVMGRAVDLGGWDATAWLSENGAAYGLCQTYANESWHFELRAAAPQEGCPTPFPDPSHDPRLR